MTAPPPARRAGSAGRSPAGGRGFELLRRTGLLACLVALALAAWWQRQTVLDAFEQVLASPALAGVLVLVAVQTAVAGLRFAAVTDAARPGHRLPLGRLLRTHLLAQAANTVVPSWLGDAVLKSRTLLQGGLGGQRAVAVVLADRSLDLLLALALAPAGLALGAGVLAPWAAGLVAAACAVLAPLAARRLARSGGLRMRVLRRRMGRHAGPALWALGRVLVVPGRAHLLTLARQVLMTAVTLVVFALAVGPPPSMALILGVPLAQLAAALPVTVNGLGVREGAWVAILAAAGTAPADAFAFALALLACNLAAHLLTAAVLLALTPPARALARRSAQPA